MQNVCIFFFCLCQCIALPPGNLYPLSCGVPSSTSSAFLPLPASSYLSVLHHQSIHEYLAVLSLFLGECDSYCTLSVRPLASIFCLTPGYILLTLFPHLPFCCTHQWHLLLQCWLDKFMSELESVSRCFYYLSLFASYIFLTHTHTVDLSSTCWCARTQPCTHFFDSNEFSPLSLSPSALAGAFMLSLALPRWNAEGFSPVCVDQTVWDSWGLSSPVVANCHQGQGVYPVAADLGWCQLPTAHQ